MLNFLNISNVERRTLAAQHPGSVEESCHISRIVTFCTICDSLCDGKLSAGTVPSAEGSAEDYQTDASAAQAAAVLHRTALTLFEAVQTGQDVST